MSADSIIEWRPGKVLQSRDVAPEFALLILNQPLRNGVNLRKLWRNCKDKCWTNWWFWDCLLTRRHVASLRVAADGGANRLHELSSFQGKFVSLFLMLFILCLDILMLATVP